MSSKKKPTKPAKAKKARAVPEAATTDATGDARKQRLQTLKAQLAQGKKPPPAPAGGPAAGGAAQQPRNQGAELNKFIRDMAGKKQNRQYQLKLIKEFFDNPLAFGAETNIIPTSSSRGEIEERKKEVRYRIELLKSIMAVLEGEMEVLNRGRPIAEEGGES